MLTSANGIVATTEVLFNDLIRLIYVVPSGQYDRRWVLYDPELWDLVPCGYTNNSVSQSCFKDTSWGGQRVVYNDSYACSNPHCGLFNPKGFTACVTRGCKFTFEAVTGPSKVALPGSVSNDKDEVTTKEIEDYGLRIAKHSVRSLEKKVYVYKPKFLMWKQVVRCLDWRRKWDLIWIVEDNLNKLQKGGSRWHSGQQWNPPSQTDFNRMSQNYPYGTPGSDEFYAKHQASICDGSPPNHKHMATVYTCGNLCDKLEEDFADLILNLPRWQETEAKGVRANTIYDKELKRLLEICGETLESMVADLKGNANALGEEKARHAAWLDQVRPASL